MDWSIQVKIAGLGKAHGVEGADKGKVLGG